MKLSDFELSDAEIRDLRRWFQERRIAREQAQQAEYEALLAKQLAERRADQITEIARQYAAQHGPLAWMMDEHQATAAYDSWYDGAGYADLEGGEEVDFAEQELWEQAYIGRLEELRADRRAT